MALTASTLLGTGCANMEKRLLLKEYGPSVPPSAYQSLKGVTICLKGFDSATNLVSLEPTNKPEEPKPHKWTFFADKQNMWMDFTDEQYRIWYKEMEAMQQQAPKAYWREIGNIRWGGAIIISHVYALNDAGVWLAEGLKYDLEKQGAKVVDASQSTSADVSISGTIQLCRLDNPFCPNRLVSGDLLVDIDVQPRQGALQHRQIRTQGATTLYRDSEDEYFLPLRVCRQKFSIIATREIIQALKPNL